MLKIYGSFDDLIEVHGDIEEEYADNDFYEQTTYLVLSNEMIVSVYMDEWTGYWPESNHEEYCLGILTVEEAKEKSTTKILERSKALGLQEIIREIEG